MENERGHADSDVLAMTLYMPIILYKSIELAGAVKDLVYHALTEEQPFIATTHAMFTKAGDAVLDVPGDDVGECFAAAMAAVRNMQDPAVAAITKVVSDQVENATVYLPYYGVNQAAAAAFASAFPDKAVALAEGHTNLDYFKELARVFWAGMTGGPAGWPLKGHTKAAFERDSRVAASRAVRAALADCGNAFAVAAAAHAVMVDYIPDHPSKFLKQTAPGICKELSVAISKTGASREWASEITDAMLYGARMYPHDGVEASGEVAVRAVRAAHYHAAYAAARAAFCTIYSLAAGGAWTISPDQDRFESVHGEALDAAAGVNRMIYYAFDKFKEHSWKEPPYEPAVEDVWEFFSNASGLPVSEWAEMAQKIDYRAAAVAAENASLIGTYTKAHDGASEAASRAALETSGKQ